jgi:cholesterol transport system auxiliary component
MANSACFISNRKDSAGSLRAALALLILPAALLLGACASNPAAPAGTLYDFGPPPAQAAALSLPALSLAEISGPPGLDRPDMMYRLAYANPQQPRPYADSRWSMTPAQLLEQRLKMRIAAAGGVVTAATNNALNLPLLRIELDDFSQDFEAPAVSNVQIRVRATLFSGRLLLAQKSFARQLPAPSADAAGGAQALAAASDLLIDDLLQWLSAVPLKK